MAVLARNVSHRRSRRRNLAVNQPQPTTPIYITGGAVTGSVLTLTFDQAVTLEGTPGITSAAHPVATPVSAVQTAPNVVDITFSAVIEGALMLSIPFRDPAIRNAAGGYVTGTEATIG
ncbi:MAG: hypothetical protein WD042_14945 [Phycisphaeraceae bacterium]